MFFFTNKKNSGFTLVELLCIIAILSLIVGVVLYISIGVIDDAKEDSYKVTVNNIKKEANSYLIENSDSLFYVAKPNDVSHEYQCITVKTLVDNGYFKGDVIDSYVSKDRNVMLSDYIYLEREVNSKTVSLIEYIYDSNYELCNNAMKAIGSVSINYSPSDYSSYKEISLLYVLKNYYNINDYSYEYKYERNSYTYGDTVSIDVISDNGDNKLLKVYDNGRITGYIKNKNSGEIVASNYMDITNIDKTPPVINTIDIIKVYGSVFDLCTGLTITDNSSMDTSCKTFLNDVEITDSRVLSLGDNIVYHEATDMFGNVSERVSRKITLVVSDKEFNYLEEDQYYTVEADGTYIVYAYGAQGGNLGGKGGYVAAEVDLKMGDKLVINTGGINGYNGGGGYKDNKYTPGGGSSTVKLNDSYLVIAGGGGAKGTSGTGGTGGSGNGNGGAAPDSKAEKGINGSNGGGGSNSLDYKYECNCQTCGGECTKYEEQCGTCSGTKTCNCREDCIEQCQHINSGSSQGYYCTKDNCQTVCDTCTTSYDCNCKDVCTRTSETYKCNCKTCTKNGNSGNGGASSVGSGVSIIENVAGNRSGNGYVKISYKMED